MQFRWFGFKSYYIFYIGKFKFLNPWILYLRYRVNRGLYKLPRTWISDSKGRYIRNSFKRKINYVIWKIKQKLNDL